MKVLLINGSPRKNGNTNRALEEIAATLTNHEVDSEILWIGTKAVQGCIACNKCRSEIGRCVFQDDVYNHVYNKIQEADGIVVGSPTYFAGPNGSLCSLLDRVFYSGSDYLRYKPGAAIAVCRRGGASACLDRLNKYFMILNMPLVPSQYWNIIHGLAEGEVEYDAEGLQTMRTLARNMSWLIKSINNERSLITQEEPRLVTNFIRE